MPIFRHRLGARLDQSRRPPPPPRAGGFLHAEILLLLDQLLERLEIGELGAELLFHQRLADIDALLDDRDHGLELVDGGRGCGLFGFLLRLPGA